MEAIEAAYWAGAGAILLLTMIIFIDKKDHTELMIWLKSEGEKERAITGERAATVDAINERELK